MRTIGNLTISGSLIVSGSTTIEGHIIPNTTETYDLGSPTKKWRDLYLSGSTIYLGDTKLTSGDSGSLEVKDSNNNILPIVAKSIHVGDGTNMIEIRRDNQRGTVKFVSSTIQETGELVSSDSVVVGTYSGSFTGSFVGDGSQLSGVTSYTDSDTLSYINSIGVVSGSVNWDTLVGKPSGIISSSAQLSTEISGAFTSTSASFASDIQNNDTRLSTLESKTLVSSSAQVSYTGITDIPNGIVSSSAQLSTEISGAFASVSASIASDIANISTDFADITNKPTLVSSSLQIDYNSIQNQPTIPTNNNQLINGAGYCTTDTTYTANDMLTCVKTVDGAGSGLDADLLDGNQASAFYLASNPSGYTTYSDSDTLSYINSINVVSGSVNWDTLVGKPANIVSSSAQLSNQTIPGNLTIGGTITAQEFHTEFVSASIIYESGSTQFGDTTDDIHTFIGTISATTIQNVLSSSAQIDYNSIPNRITNNNQLTNGAGYTTCTGDITGVTAGTGLSGGGTSGAVTVSHADTSTLTGAQGSAGIASITVDALGHVTAVTTATYCTTDTNTTYTANEMLTCIKTVDGAGSGLDADTLDGNQASAFYLATNPSGYTSCTGTLTGTGTSGYISKWNGSTSQTNSIIYDDGTNVGIGTTSPAEKLHVVGNIVATGNITGYYSSDERLKENKEVLKNPIDKINKISGYEFDWKELPSHGVPKHDVGVIAQEIEKVLPEIVARRDDGYLAVRYEKIVPLLIEGTKELSKEVESLKDIIKNNGITK